MASHPMKLLHGNSSKKRLSSSSSHDDNVAIAVTVSSKKPKVNAVLLVTKDDDDNSTNQLQISNNKLRDENAALRIENETLKASTTMVSPPPSLVVAATTSGSSTILAPFVASVLRDQTLTDLLKENQQLRDRTANQIVMLDTYGRRVRRLKRRLAQVDSGKDELIAQINTLTESIPFFLVNGLLGAVDDIGEYHDDDDDDGNDADENNDDRSVEF